MPADLLLGWLEDSPAAREERVGEGRTGIRPVGILVRDRQVATLAGLISEIWSRSRADKVATKITGPHEPGADRKPMPAATA